MSKINVLSKEISELIAAGEVIDRPASIIKELLENAIDAGANVITVEIKNGGKTYIRVTDNGCGISKDDIATAFLRHATSKIKNKNDLQEILTLGFRGEALASICAVSKVEVLSKMQNESYGTHYVIEGSVEKICESSGCPDGTTFVIRDIFYNVPARLKFLKKDTTEGNAVATYVTKIALSHPEISFKFIRDNKTELLTAGDGQLYSAIYAVFGRDFAKSLIPVDYTDDDIHINGYISKPLESKNNRKFQNFFVNHRYIKSVICANALEEAYKNNIMTGRFPAAVININLEPNVVDVNVHPTKIEVRFSDNKLIYETVYFAVKNSLLSLDKPKELNLDVKRNFTDKQLYEAPIKDTAQQLRFNYCEPSKFKSQESHNTSKAVSVSEKTEMKASGQPYLKEPIEQDDFKQPVNYSYAEDKDTSINTLEHTETYRTYNIKSKTDDIPEEIAEELSEFKYITNEDFKHKQENDITVDNSDNSNKQCLPIVIGELFKTYIVAQAGDDMLLFDKHAAHERYIFEKIKNDSEQLDVQMYLEPIMVLLSYEEYDALVSNNDKLTELGFDIEPDVAPTVAVKGAPMVLDGINPTDIVTELAENFIEYKINPQLHIFDELFHSIACKAAIKANDNSSKIELQALVNAVYNNENIKYCPHGRPVMIKLSKKDIEKQFKRIV